VIRSLIRRRNSKGKTYIGSIYEHVALCLSGTATLLQCANCFATLTLHARRSQERSSAPAQRRRRGDRQQVQNTNQFEDSRYRRFRKCSSMCHDESGIAFRCRNRRRRNTCPPSNCASWSSDSHSLKSLRLRSSGSFPLQNQSLSARAQRTHSVRKRPKRSLTTCCCCSNMNRD
jgi:hypothetical protein